MLRFVVRGAIGATLFTVAWAGGTSLPEAHAQQLQSSAAPAGCTTDNLIAGMRPWQWQDIRNNFMLVTDGSVAPEGAQWDAPPATVLETGAGTLTYDLGQVRAIGALYLQADANDSYKVWGSMDGAAGSWKQIVEIDGVTERGHGLRNRTVQISPFQLRYLRVGEGLGDGFYSISEFAVYCQAPSPFPPQMKVTDAPAAQVSKRPWYKLEWWDDKVSARFEMVLALAAMLILLWGWAAARHKREWDVPEWVPFLVGGASLVVHIGITALIWTGSYWLPGWLTVLFGAFSCACTLALLFPDGAWRLVETVAKKLPRSLAKGVRARRHDADRPPGWQAVGAPAASRVRNQLLVMVGLLSFLAYWNFGTFHFGNYVHYWDTYHYYMGSKYFNELGYDRLYDCVTVADWEDPSLKRRAELRKVMNLRTNVLGATTEVLAHPERCKQPFTAARWEEFKKDGAFFRNRLGVKRWEEAQTDHGYNGSPVWNILGTLLTNTGPATDQQIKWLTIIDPMFIIGMALMIWWAFGWRTLCVALAVFATNFPSRFYWTGGSLLRWDWLFYMTAGVCLLKKDKNVLGGFLLGYATLLRLFPGFIFLGPGFVIIQQIRDQIRNKTPQLSKEQSGYRPLWKRFWRPVTSLIMGVERRYLAIVLGGALALFTLVPLSFGVSGGPSRWYPDFKKNSDKHVNTPLTNYMGWRTVVVAPWGSARHETSELLRRDRPEPCLGDDCDPWKDWKDARVRQFGKRKVLYIAGFLVALMLLYRAVRRSDPWVAAAIASFMIAMGHAELTCYYYSFLVVLALLWHKRQEAGIAMLAVTASTGFIDMAPTQFLVNSAPWKYFKVMPTWLAEQYWWMSATTLLGMGWILIEFGWLARREAPVAVDAAEAPGTSASDAELPSAPARKSTGARRSGNKRRR